MYDNDQHSNPSMQSKRLQQVIPTSLASGGMGNGGWGWDGCVARDRGPFLLAFGVYRRWF